MHAKCVQNEKQQRKQQNKLMSCLRVILAILFPPLAVIDQGCGSVLIVFLLTLCGWVPGVIGALIILNNTTKDDDVQDDDE